MGSSAVQAVVVAAVFLIFFGILFGCRPEQQAQLASPSASADLTAKFKQQQLLKENLLAEIAALDRQLQRLKTTTPEKTQSSPEPTREQQHFYEGGGGARADGVENGVENSVAPWEFVTDSVYYLTESSQASITPHVFTSPFAERRLELKALVMDARRLATSPPPPPVAPTSSAALRYMHGFLHFDGLSGLDGEFHFSRAGSSSVFALRAERRFSRPVVVSSEAVRKNGALVHMIMPLAGRLDKFAFFLDTLAAVRARYANVFLTVVYFGKQGRAEAEGILARKLDGTAGQVPAYRFLAKSGGFSRGGGLQHGATATERWPKQLAASALTSATLFFIDVDILFDVAAVLRCRLLSERGKRVYYPMVFSQYNPSIAYRHLDEPPPLRERIDHNYSSGFWRSFGFGMACMHYSDFVASGGFDLNIEGWGVEDVMLYRKFIAQRKVAVVRAVDRGLFHMFHEKVCDRKLSGDQLRMCLGTKGVNEASPEQMGYLLYK